MQWWCSAGQGPWTWTPTAFPGVWIIVLLVAVNQWRLTRDPSTPSRDRWIGWAGVASLEIALDWPLGPLAAGYLASAHALQFLIVAFVAPPLMLIGLRHGIARMWPTTGRRTKILDALLHPVVAAVGFNILVIATHVPAVNDGLMPTQIGAFAVDIAWLIAGIWLWWPLIVRVPARTHFPVPLQMLYLFLGTLAHTGIAIVMLQRTHPMYGVYELAPRVLPLSAVDDVKIAGTIMELGGAGIIFGVLTFMFFKWSGGPGKERIAR
jgi:cytochrome c oxidase assembly factor CtaG